MIDLDFLTEQVKRLAFEIGAFLREQRQDFHADRVEQKRAHDYVSYVDKESERRIVARLHELLPEAGFMAEEGSGTKFPRNIGGWWIRSTVRPILSTTMRPTVSALR